ncbi:MAG: ABC transporter substrate-binding protein [Spirochaeta sp.]|nr:ABC transporter substrate-binding protein [Spirochaeta sp.]
MTNTLTKSGSGRAIAVAGLFFLFTLIAVLPVLATGAAEGESPGASTAKTRTVTDALGRDVTVPADPERVVTAGRAVLMIADVLYAFEDAPERIVGIGRISQGAGSFVADMDPAFDEKVVFERNVGPEQIVAVNPDLVILKTFMRESLGSPLERLGIPVLYVELETPEQYDRDIRLLGQALNEEERARSLTAYFSNSLAGIESATAPLTAAERPETLLLYYRGSGGDVSFQVPPARWIQTRIVESAGGVPVWTESVTGGGWQTVGFEQIAAWDPQVITIVSYNDDVETIRDSLASQPRWQELSAVRDGRFYAFPKDYYSWDQPDTRWILGVTWLADRLHPDLFPDLSVMEETRRFFRIVYGIDNERFNEMIAPLLSGDLD